MSKFEKYTEMSTSPSLASDLNLPVHKSPVQKGFGLSVAAISIGLLTAFSGTVIELASGFLGDLRHGVCIERLPEDTRPLWHVTLHGGWRPYNRMRCCGGSASVDHATQECRAHSIISSTSSKRFATPIHNAVSFGQEIGPNAPKHRPKAPHFMGLVSIDEKDTKDVVLGDRLSSLVQQHISSGHSERSAKVETVVGQDALSVRTHMSHMFAPDPTENWAEEAASDAHRAVLMVERTVESAVNEDAVQTQTESAGNLDPVYEWVPWDRALSLKSRSSALLISIIGSALLALCAVLVTQRAIQAKGSGIPEVRASVAGFALPRHFSSQTLLAKVMALSMCVGSGLAVGKEGPMIHIGACWACLLAGPLSRFVGLSAMLPDTELICVGAAAGVSAAFGAPLAGVLFAVEELGTTMPGGLRYSTMICAFGSAVVACLALKWLDLTRTQRLTLFEVDYKQAWAAWETLPFAFLGIMCGVLGGLFIIANKTIHLRRLRASRDCFCWFLPARVDRILKRLFHSPPGGDSRVLEVVLLAIFTCASNWPRTLTRIPQNDGIFALFSQCHTDHSPNTSNHAIHDTIGLCSTQSTPNWEILLLLLGAAALRFLQTSITFGALVPAGLFVPSLFIGGCIGRCLGVLLKFAGLPGVEGDIEPGIYAMVGAGAMLAGVSRLTISLVVVLFELTGGLTYVVPFMLSVLTAKWVGDFITDGQSVYDVHAELSGLAKVEQAEDMRLLNITMKDLCDSQDQPESSPDTLREKDADSDNVHSVQPPALWTNNGLIRTRDLKDHCNIAAKGFVVLSTDPTGDVEVLGWADPKPLADRLDTVVGEWCRLSPANLAFVPMPLCLRLGANSVLANSWRTMASRHKGTVVEDLSGSINPRGVARLRRDCPIMTALCIIERCPAVKAFVTVDGPPFAAHTLPRDLFLARLVRGRVRPLQSLDPA